MIPTVGLKIGKVLEYKRYQLEVAGNIFNLLNGGNYTQYSYNSAYQSWSSNFLLMVNQQPVSFASRWIDTESLSDTVFT